LADAGLDVEDTAHAAHLFFSYVTSFSYQETVLPASTPTGDRAASLALVEHYLSSLPPDDFPHVTRCAQALSRPGLDRRFTFGLDRLIRGLTPS
jgi:TetR/AcrR family tetracycline transcriptional repressor